MASKAGMGDVLVDTTQRPWWRPSQRYILALVSFFGFFAVYAMRVNLSTAIIDMRKEYDWSNATRGRVLGAFFYGYLITQIPGGWMASKFGGKWVFGLGVLTTAVLTLVTPVVAKYEWLFLLVRVVEGLGEAVTFPAMHAMLARWAPPLERSKLATLTYSGAYMGTVVSFPLSGYLCKTSLWGGWPSVFYVIGIYGVVWFFFWVALATNSPEEDRFISSTEREYITTAIANDKPIAEDMERSVNAAPKSTATLYRTGPLDNGSPPWRAIFTSMPVWAIIVAHFTNNWGFYMLLTCLPSYMKDVLDFDIKHAGFDSAIPYLTLFILTLVAGRVVDYMREVKKVRTVVVRKVVTVAAFLLSGLFLVLAGYSPTTGSKAKTTIVVLLSASVGMSSLGLSGWNCNHLDIAPSYAGVLMGITNTVATIPGFAAPAFVNAIATAPSADHHKLRGQWQVIFFTAAGIYVAGAVFYALFASGSKQPWADTKGAGCCRRVSKTGQEPLLASEVSEIGRGSSAMFEGGPKAI